MCRAGFTLDDVPARVSWRALSSFAAHLDVESATVQELSPELATWNRADRVPAMLADLIDAVNGVRWVLECANTPKKRRRPKQPERYPRPGADKKDAKRIGSEPIPIREFNAWWEGGEGLWREEA